MSVPLDATNTACAKALRAFHALRIEQRGLPDVAKQACAAEVHAVSILDVANERAPATTVMTRDIYIAAAERGSGKSVIALGIMEMLKGRSDRVGVFRPLQPTPEQPDMLAQLLSSRYQLTDGQDLIFGSSDAAARELIAADRYDELLQRMLERFAELKERCDQVLCIGTDYSRTASALEFDFNTDLANNLGCVIMPVVLGHGRSVAVTAEATVAFEESLESRHCDVLATVINRVAPSHVAALTAQLATRGGPPRYVVRNHPTLDAPTLADVQRALAATRVWGDHEQLSREVLGYKVAAMQLPHFLDYVAEGDLIIVPGDRADIIVGSLLSYASGNYPQIAGLVLTGGLAVAPQVQKLIDGLGKPAVAALAVVSDTFTAAMQISQVRSALAAENSRKIALALGLVEQSIDSDDLARRLTTSSSSRVTPLMFEHALVRRAKQHKRHIVLPEGSDERVLRAAEILALREVVDITLLGNVAEVRSKIAALGLHLNNVTIIDPLTAEERQPFADTYFSLRRHKGISVQMAFDIMADVSYFGTMMVYLGHADGMVSGAMHTTQHTIRPAFEFIKTRADAELVSSVFFMCLPDRVLVYGDCAVNPNPSAEQLADIAIASASTASAFDIEPRVAMLSYSTGDSGKGEDVERVRRATEIARRRRPQLMIEGPIQYDAAVDAAVAKTKLPDSQVAGRATVFIFPDLNTGNNTYKAVQRTAGAVAVGPILQGLNKPVNDLSRGCSVADIVNTVAITAIQAQRQDTG
jgi:phosphate acetyltransferase